MRKLWKYSGYYIIITGVIHIIVAFIDIYNADLNNELERDLVFWFLVVGVLITMFGRAIQDNIDITNKPAPFGLGLGMLLLSITGIAIIPMSGFWILLPQALIILFSKD